MVDVVTEAAYALQGGRRVRETERIVLVDALEQSNVDFVELLCVCVGLKDSSHDVSPFSLLGRREQLLLHCVVNRHCFNFAFVFLLQLVDQQFLLKEHEQPLPMRKHCLNEDLELSELADERDDIEVACDSVLAGVEDVQVGILLDHMLFLLVF